MHFSPVKGGLSNIEINYLDRQSSKPKALCVGTVSLPEGRDEDCKHLESLK